MIINIYYYIKTSKNLIIIITNGGCTTMQKKSFEGVVFGKGVNLILFQPRFDEGLPTRLTAGLKFKVRHQQTDACLEPENYFRRRFR